MVLFLPRVALELISHTRFGPKHLTNNGRVPVQMAKLLLDHGAAIALHWICNLQFSAIFCIFRVVQFCAIFVRHGTTS